MKTQLQTAIALAAEVQSESVLVFEPTLGRRTTAESILVRIEIALTSLNTVDSISNKLNSNLNSFLLAKGIQGATLQSVTTTALVSANNVGSLITVIVPTLVVSMLLTMIFIAIFMLNKTEPEEERKLRSVMEALRAHLHITQIDGYLLRCSFSSPL